MEKFLIGSLFIFGIIYRLWLVGINPQPLVYDQQDYGRYAESILKSGLSAQTARTYGYPAFIALVMKIFGEGHLEYVKTVQSSLDSLAGLLVFFTALRLFSRKLPAYTAFILYQLNPWTSVYAGVILTESLTVFLIAVIYFLFAAISDKYKKGTAAFLCLVLGFITQVRPSFLIFSIGMMIMLFISPRIQKTKSSILAMTFLFLLPFVYTVLGNLKYYRQFSPVTVDNLMVRELYLSLYLDFQNPEANSYPYITGVYGEFSEKPTVRERKAVQNKYLILTIKEIQKDPMKFILQRLNKSYYMWQKTGLYTYQDLENGKLMNILSFLNNILVVFSLAGVILFGNDINRNKPFRFPFWAAGTFMFIYITLFHIFTVGEQRYTLPAYPLVFLFASYAIFRIQKKFN